MLLDLRMITSILMCWLTIKEGQGMGLYYYPTEQDKEEWKKGEKELYNARVMF